MMALSKMMAGRRCSVFSRYVLLVSFFSTLIFAADRPPLLLFPEQGKSLDQLSRQALDRQIAAAVMGRQPSTRQNPVQMAQVSNPDSKVQTNCSIPLKEVNAPHPYRLDPMAHPLGNTSFDRMARPAALPACKNWLQR
jgi:hypothetical protein